MNTAITNSMIQSLIVFTKPLCYCAGSNRTLFSGLSICRSLIRITLPTYVLQTVFMLSALIELPQVPFLLAAGADLCRLVHSCNFLCP
jgi:hypothetical protein